MQSTVTEIAPDTFRISAFNPDYGIQFNQFLVRDAEPFLMHTGLKRMFPTTLAAVRTLIDPATLRWIGYSHFEPDECGALNEWSAVAPRVQALSGFVGAMVMLQDYADRPGKTLADGEVLPLGRHRLRYLATPHVPHGWDAGFFFDETEGTLLGKTASWRGRARRSNSAARVRSRTTCRTRRGRGRRWRGSQRSRRERSR